MRRPIAGKVPDEPWAPEDMPDASVARPGGPVRMGSADDHCRSRCLMTSPPLIPPEAQAVHDLAAAYEKLTAEIGKVIVGQKEVVEQVLMSLFSRGHCLLVGVPGLAKTLLVSTVSRVLHLTFKRIQFT